MIQGWEFLSLVFGVNHSFCESERAKVRIALFKTAMGVIRSRHSFKRANRVKSKSVYKRIPNPAMMPRLFSLRCHVCFL